MSRYIDADKIEEVIRNEVPLKYFMTSSYNFAIKNGLKIAEILNDKIPTADVVEVVHCKDCRHYERFTVYNKHFCNEYGGFVVENDFCSRAEKKGEKE